MITLLEFEYKYSKFRQIPLSIYILNDGFNIFVRDITHTRSIKTNIIVTDSRTDRNRFAIKIYKFEQQTEVLYPLLYKQNHFEKFFDDIEKQILSGEYYL